MEVLLEKTQGRTKIQKSHRIRSKCSSFIRKKVALENDTIARQFNRAPFHSAAFGSCGFWLCGSWLCASWDP